MFVWKQLRRNKVIRPSDKMLKGDSVMHKAFISYAVHIVGPHCGKILNAISPAKNEKKTSMHQLTWSCFFLWPKTMSWYNFFPLSFWFIISFIPFFFLASQNYHNTTISQLNRKWKMNHYFWWVFQIILIKLCREPFSLVSTYFGKMSNWNRNFWIGRHKFIELKLCMGNLKIVLTFIQSKSCGEKEICTSNQFQLNWAQTLEKWYIVRTRQQYIMSPQIEA